MTRFRKFLIIIGILALIILGVILWINNSQQSVPSLPQEEQEEKTSEEKVSLEANYTGRGVLLNDDERWIILYDEPGRPAAFLLLKFTENSICDLGEGEKTCDTSNFIHGTTIEVSGYKEGQELTVVRITGENN